MLPAMSAAIGRGARAASWARLLGELALWFGVGALIVGLVAVYVYRTEVAADLATLAEEQQGQVDLVTASLARDIEILLATLPAVISGRGAY